MIEEGTTSIGIDLGTSHCTAAVWDSTRGHPKWMRSALARPEATKEGRIIPSVILFATKEQVKKKNWRSFSVDRIFPEHESLAVCVGEPALQALQDAKDNTSPSYSQISGAMITSTKRLLGLSRVNYELRSALTLTISEPEDRESDEEIILHVRPIGYHQDIHVTPSQATCILLNAIKISSEIYLRTQGKKKNLRVPGESGVRCANAVIGVPAHYTVLQRQCVMQAARKAGFTGQVSLLTESTAACMAYGIFVSRDNVEKTILVFDSGGGTTDVTIATMAGGADEKLSEDSQRFKVVVTNGDSQLGGDDMDAALLAAALEKLGVSARDVQQDRRQLLSSCRRAKERLCGDVDHGYSKPESSVVLEIAGKKCELTQSDLDRALHSWIHQAAGLVRESLERYSVQRNIAIQDVRMDEVILVGGATRVPAVRNMLRDIFLPPHPPDLCLSVDAMAAVAQGAAIQAAILSGRIPMHEIRSAMMLDTVPHAIGIFYEDTMKFIEIISRDETLPASGSAVFQLAKLEQPGVSFTVVEDIGDGKTYPKVGDFTFLLTHLSKERLGNLNGNRLIEVRMGLSQSGEFKVSIYDENDPEHDDTRNPNNVKINQAFAPILSFRKADGGISFEQLVLFISCIFLLCAYVAARVYFQEELALKAE